MRMEGRGPLHDGLAEVRARLQEYAERGVFRGLAERPARRGRHEFTFRWLAPSPFTLSYDSASGTLAFRDLLPNVPARSPLAGALRRFVRGRTAAELPPHRRVDPSARTCAASSGGPHSLSRWWPASIITVTA